MPAEATGRLLERVAALGLRDSLGTEAPATLEEALKLVERYATPPGAH